MEALEGSFSNRTQKAFKAGCDVILHCNGYLGEMIEIAGATPALSEVSLERLSKIALIFAITSHEAAHGAMALAFGDDTAKRMGRLSANPLRHVDPLGTVPVPVNFSSLKPKNVILPITPMEMLLQVAHQVLVEAALLESLRLVFDQDLAGMQQECVAAESNSGAKTGNAGTGTTFPGALGLGEGAIMNGLQRVFYRYCWNTISIRPTKTKFNGISIRPSADMVFIVFVDRHIRVRLNCPIND
eukprot:gene13448-13564_t